MREDDRSPTSPSATALTMQLASRISDLIRADGAAPGARLAERRLAERLRVSRSPVRSALRLLADRGVAEPGAAGGYVVGKAPGADRPMDEAGESAEDRYRAIATDRLDGKLGDRVTERDLARRYGMTRMDVQRILHRIAGEGWIERLPGHGWAFMPTLTSLESYRASYRFRLTIEPAAILEETFVLDRDRLQSCRAQQQRMVAGDIWTVTSAALFDINSQFHETIIECSRNSFFIEGLRRVNRLRRLIEYRQELDRRHAIIRSREHVRLVDLLLAGQREEAADLMRQHLRSLGFAKTSSSDPSRSVNP